MDTGHFATTCDSCGRKSPVNTAWPTCRECSEDVCQNCTESGSLLEGEDGKPDLVTCKTCAAAEKTEINQLCQHQYEEQPGEPPRDVCIKCGDVQW